MTVWLFRRFVARRWLRNPVRPMLMLVAVFLATTLWSAVLRATFSGIGSFEDSLGLKENEFPLVITPQGGRIIASELSACLAALSSTFDLLGIRRESAVLSKGDRTLAVRMIGIGSFGGSLPEGVVGDLDGTTLVATRQVVDAMSLREQEEVSLQVGEVALVARVQRQESITKELVGGSVSVPLSRIASLAPMGAVDAVLLKSRTSRPGVVAPLRDDLTAWLKGCYRGGVPLRVDTAQTRIERGEGLLAAYRFNVLVMASMTLLVCILLVSQATHAGLLTLSRELSIVRTLGLGVNECMGMVVLEAAVLGTVGALLGISVGHPLILQIAGFLTGTASEIYKITLNDLGGKGLFLSEVGVVATVIVVSIFGAFVGGLQALRISPNLGTRREFVHVKPISARIVVGMAALTGVAFVIALGAVMVFPALWSSYLFVLVCVVLVVGCTPLLVYAVSLVARSLPSALVMRLAAGGVRMSGREYVLAAMGASVAITLMVALTLMVESFRGTLQRWVDRRLQGDLFISSRIEGEGNEGRLAPSFVRDVAAIAGVRSAVPYYESKTVVRDRPVVVGATDMGTQVQQGVYRVTAGTVDARALAAGSACFVSESAARKLGLQVGDAVHVASRVISVQAVIEEFGTEQPMIVVDDDLFLALYPGHSPQSLIVYLKDGTAGEPVRALIEERGRASVVVRDQRELKELVMVLFDRTFRVTDSVRWIVFGMAVLGLVVSALQLLWERRREVKTLVVLGASSVQLVGWSVLEGALVSLGPLALGVVMGTVMGWALTALINPISFGWTLEFSLSYAPLLVSVAFAVCVTGLLVLTVSLAVGGVVRRTALADE